MPGGQVGREGEVRRVGVLNDSYKLLPEQPLLCSTQAVGYDTAPSIDVKSFFLLPCWKSSKLSIWPESSLRVGVPDTWPTS